MKTSATGRKPRTSAIPAAMPKRKVRGCAVCNADRKFLRRRRRPKYEESESKRTVRVADIFCGCGGLALGVAEAARRFGMATNIVLAVDSDDDAVAAFRLNFPKARVETKDAATLFDRHVGEPLSDEELRCRRRVGQVDILVSGPPCQGHSNLNNRTRRDDPKNALYLTAARAAEVLRPTFVLIENVPAVEHDSKGVVSKARRALEDAGYTVKAAPVKLGDFGVPQTRRRHILIASRDDRVAPTDVLAVASECADHLPRTLRWAVEDLADAKPLDPLDTPSTPSADNAKRIKWLFANRKYDLPNAERPECHWGDHSYRSMYGRLRWDQPAQTITTGFGSMGQGRYVHPSRHRTLTAHEAARLQTFPDFFTFGTAGKGALARMIANAVPPLVVLPLVAPMLEQIRTQPSQDRRAATKRGRPGVPAASSPESLRRMQSARQRDTKPELAIRSLLNSAGLLYLVDRPPLPGVPRRADMVFPTAKVAVYVDGCFWHGCPQHGTSPKSNGRWWAAKLEANRIRDADTTDQLRLAGWTVLRFWEHDDPSSAAARVQDVVAKNGA